METPSSEQRRRGRQRNTPSGASESAAASSSSSPSPARRRGCNCKKSGCLKLYCECFSAGLRCGDRCQCLGCKNRDHNKLEIAHALETIEKRSQRSFKSPVAVTRKLGTLRTSTPQAHSTPQTSHSHHHSPREFVTPSYGLRTPVLDGATRLLMSAERLEETPRQMSTPAALECICAPGSCHGGCPCHAQFGGCGRRCPCNQYVAPPPPVTPAQEKTRGCSCKKSNCLKLYCECLAAQRLCDSRCNCEGCKNHPDHVHERERAITAILERNPNAFQPKVASGAAQHQRGCNCRKSNCMKNYCECHQAGVPCTGRCACQDCRNTDAFVSAKKMLIFSGDLKVRGGNNMGTPDHRMHAMTPSSAKPPRRPPRRASLDHSSPPSHFQTPTLQPSSALEMLSRTAPPAPQQDAYAVLARMQTNVKRKLSDSTYEDDGAYDSSTDAKKRGTKTTVSRPNFQERLERAASSETAHLPPVESVLKDELDPSQPDLPLSKLCRSLLNAATSAEASPTPRKPERSPGIVRGSAVGRAREVSNQDQQHTEPEGAVSPMTDDLLCEEDIETPTRGKVVPLEGEERQRASTVRLAALQERAVLQEFSVWLRNLATSATPTKPPLPQ